MLLVTVMFAVSVARAEESDDETRARKRALDVAGAFANEGFKVRDGHWSGSIGRDRTLIAVNLYAANQYWFSAGATDQAKKVGIELFDETGRQLPTEHYEDVSRVAAGFSPTMSGQYFVALSVPDGGQATGCLIYSYK